MASVTLFYPPLPKKKCGVLPFTKAPFNLIHSAFYAVFVTIPLMSRISGLNIYLSFVLVVFLLPQISITINSYGMKEKIFQKLKQEFSHLGLGDVVLQAHADSLAAIGLVTDENIDTVILHRMDFSKTSKKQVTSVSPILFQSSNRF